MSYNETDYAMDRFWEEYGPSIERAEWELDRLRSHFLAEPTLIKRPREILAKAIAVQPVHNEAAFVFAVGALEVGLKAAMKVPLLIGLIHRPSVARVVEKSLDVKRDALVSMLIAVLGDLLGIPMNEYKRPGASRPLHEELRLVQNRRNDVLHSGESVPPHEVDFAVGVARHVLHDLFDLLMNQLELDVQGDEVKGVRRRRGGPFPPTYKDPTGERPRLGGWDGE